MVCLQFINNDEEHADIDHCYARVQDAQQAGVEAPDLGLEREGLAFVAGYVAMIIRHINASLGCVTSAATDGMLASVPSS